VSAHATSPVLADFIRANTRLSPVPYVPEIRLHLADEVFELWTRTEAQLGAALPFWAFAWAGGQALARYLLDNPALVGGRSSFDLAAGSGLVGIAAARAGAAAVTAADLDPLAAEAIALNAAANAVTVRVALGDAMAGDATAGDATAGDAGGAEVVLAGDVCYERSLAVRVLPFLQRAAQRGALVLVGDPGRPYLPRRRLTAVASYRLPVAGAVEDAPVKQATVWWLAPAAGAAGSPSGATGSPPGAAGPPGPRRRPDHAQTR
jgi:predicted nicotinamide N-methyase